jgi:hypothetical protein
MKIRLGELRKIIREMGRYGKSSYSQEVTSYAYLAPPDDADESVPEREFEGKVSCHFTPSDRSVGYEGGWDEFVADEQTIVELELGSNGKKKLPFDPSADTALTQKIVDELERYAEANIDELADLEGPDPDEYSEPSGDFYSGRYGSW